MGTRSKELVASWATSSSRDLNNQEGPGWDMYELPYDHPDRMQRELSSGA